MASNSPFANVGKVDNGHQHLHKEDSQSYTVYVVWSVYKGNELLREEVKACAKDRRKTIVCNALWRS